ncbi:MAG TPA: VanZ family protein [Candidatus Pacearchaeota archaeon]|nr:VanZ family protein [Candidatus Pacearchaeota archaeon]
MIRWLEKNRYVAIILTILIAIEIFYFSSIPGTTVPGGIPGVSMIYHFLVFFLFNFFLLISIKGQEKINSKHVLIALLISISYSVLDEVHQMFVPLRMPDILDVLTDTAGIVLSTILIFYFNKKKS